MNENKNEYINKQKAIERFEEIKNSGVSFRDAIYLDGVIAVLETLPVEDVAPIVRGRWIRKPSDIGTIDVEKCSVCGCEMTERNQFWDAKTCPVCSARMDGDFDV